MKKHIFCEINKHYVKWFLKPVFLDTKKNKIDVIKKTLNLKPSSDLVFLNKNDIEIIKENFDKIKQEIKISKEKVPENYKIFSLFFYNPTPGKKTAEINWSFSESKEQALKEAKEFQNETMIFFDALDEETINKYYSLL